MNTNRNENAHLFVLCTYTPADGTGTEDISGTVEDAVALAVANGCEVRGWKSGRANPTLFAFWGGTYHIVAPKRRSAKVA